MFQNQRIYNSNTNNKAKKNGSFSPAIFLAVNTRHSQQRLLELSFNKNIH